MKKLVVVYILLAISLVLNVVCLSKISALNKDIKNISDSYYELDAKIDTTSHKLKRQIEQLKDDLDDAIEELSN